LGGAPGRTRELGQKPIEPLPEGALAKIVTLPSIVGAKLKLSVGIDVELVISPSAELLAFIDPFLFAPVLPHPFGTKFLVCLFNVSNFLLGELVLIDILGAIQSGTKVGTKFILNLAETCHEFFNLENLIPIDAHAYGFERERQVSF
jgi:hypothetical protein